MKKLSIILPVHNELQYTRWCIFSIINRTSVDYECLVVNDHSDEKTTNFLKRACEEYGFKYLETISRGWHSATCNHGIQNSNGEYICLLNSDAILSTNWDTHLIGFLESERGRNASVVGPSTSYSASHQTLPQYHNIRHTIKYHETEDVAKEVYGRYRHQYMITRVTGFCMLFHRRMLETIGRLDETMFPSAGNENDWIIRGLKKGLEPIWVKYCYVHHFGQASYVKAIGQEEKMAKWAAADNNLINKHGRNMFDMIQNRYWKNQHVIY